MIINTNPVTPAQAIDMIVALWELKVAFMLWGKPGVGKSELVGQVARRVIARLYDERLNTKIASDLTGLPFPDADKGVTTFLRPEFLPTAEEKSILFLDELTTAEEQVRSAAYGLILERRVGKYALPEDCRIIAASNREEDGAVSASLGSALYDRMIHIVIEPSSDAWLRWAVDNDIHPAVMGFVRAQPNLLCASADELAGENALLPSPRSWKRISDVLKATRVSKTEPISKIARIAIEGIIGTENAARFFALAEQVVLLPPIDKLLAERDDTKVAGMLPDKVDVLFALGYALAAALNEQTANDVFRIVNIVGTLPAAVSGPEVATLAGTLACERAAEIPALATKIDASPAFQEYNRRFIETSGLQAAA